MKKIFAVIFALALFVNSALSALAFTDVPADNPYAADIKYLEERGIVTGSEFRPNSVITREQYAIWLLKSAGFKDESYAPHTRMRFGDVPPVKNNTAPYIYRLADIGIVVAERNGEKFFNPKSPVTRATALDWSFKVRGIFVPQVFDVSRFRAADVNTVSRIAPLVHAAIEYGIMNPGRVRPFAKLTRAEAANYIRKVEAATPTLTVTIASPESGSDLAQTSNYEIMEATWNQILKKYLRKDGLNRKELLYGAIEGMVKEVGDKYSAFDRPGDTTVLDSLSGEVEGIGAVIQEKDGIIEIVSPVAGSPAEAAGLLPGDIILKVDDVSVDGLSLNEVVARIKGPRGTQVKLTIKRGMRTLEFTITRQLVKIISVSRTSTSDNIAVIKIANFGENTLAEFSKILDGFSANRPAGLVIDLRNNPGGFLHTVVAMAGHFVESGKVVSLVKYPAHTEQELSTGSGELGGYRMTVLVNKGSASASEILAGLLQDYGMAKMVGEKSYGKGTVQEVTDFNDGSLLKLTVAEWLTPLGRSIEKDGIIPDIAVALTDADREAGRDPQLEAALKEVRR